LQFLRVGGYFELWYDCGHMNSFEVAVKISQGVYLDKLLGAVEDANRAAIKVTENLSALGGSILTIEVLTLPLDVDALLVVDKSTGTKRLFRRYEKSTLGAPVSSTV